MRMCMRIAATQAPPHCAYHVHVASVDVVRLVSYKAFLVWTTFLVQEGARRNGMVRASQVAFERYDVIVFEHTSA